MLNMDHGDTLSVSLDDGLLDVLKDDIRVPQRKLAIGEIVVLKVNYQQCFRHSQPPIFRSSSFEKRSPWNAPRVAQHNHQEDQRNPERDFADFSFSQPWHHKHQQPKRFINHLNQQKWRHRHGIKQAEDRAYQDRRPQRAEEGTKTFARRELPLADELPATVTAQQYQEADRDENDDVEDVRE